MASVTVTSETNKRLAGAFMKVFGRFVIGTPRDPSDFLVTLQADLGHDTTGRPGEVSAPTLLIGGTEDPFSPSAVRTHTRSNPARLQGRRTRSTERAQASLRGRRPRVPGRPPWVCVRRKGPDGAVARAGKWMRPQALLSVVVRADASRDRNRRAVHRVPTAHDTSTMMTTSESTAWITVRILTLPESTGVSVGPKAELVVKATKR